MLLQKNANINVPAVLLKPPPAKEDKKNRADSDDYSDDEDDSNASGSGDKTEKDDEKEVDSEDEEDKTKPSPWTWKLLRKRPYEPKRYPVFQVTYSSDYLHLYAKQIMQDIYLYLVLKEETIGSYFQ